MASQMRDKIVKEGVVRYRQSTIGLQKWRPRHLVFKVTHAGRLQLIVHKESPATAANEIKEIAIDEFGGLENNLKLDSEKYVFAIITTNVTECFSTESPQELTEWSQLLQEYLGKELVININVPMKQQLLKAGSGRLRIRNTGFTITTCDNPPRCQGTWHIIHIRKYGGSDMFRFQTGSKCPTGEYLYAIETKDNAGIKKLFNDLSNHRPIFSDDRLGRRMTLEKSFNRSTLNTQSRTGNNRLSLQSVDRNRHIYENREKIHESLDLHHAPRRASFDDSALDSPHMDSTIDTRQSKVLNGEDDKLYQNIHPSSATQPSRASPTKKTHLTAVSVPVPEGYYAVTPPPLVRKHHSGNASLSSSPEQTSIREDVVLMDTHPNKVSLPDREQEIAMDIVGDSLVISRSSRQHFTPPRETGENGGTYQNVEFMNGPGEDQALKRPSSEISSILPSSITEEPPWSPHNYTNVEFAQATAQGKTSAARKVKSRKHRATSGNASGQPLEQRKEDRQISMSVKDAPRNASLQRTSHVVSTSSDDLLSPLQSENSLPGLRNSVSDQELNTKDKSLDYYNYLAPKLPAHSKDQNKSLSLRGKLTLSGGRQSVESLDHSTGSAVEKNSHASVPSPAYVSIDDYKVLSNGITHGGKVRHRRSSSCDCLEIGPSVSHDEKPEVQDMYDKLVPLETVGAADVLYDRLGPGKEFKSESSSPDPESLPADSQKSIYLRKAHTYELVDGETDEQESERSRSSSPEHPSTWTSSLPVGTSSHFFLNKETKTLPRRKHLPLQESEEKNRFEAMYHVTGGKIRPPRLSRESSVDAIEHHRNRAAVNPSHARLSVDSSELLSSIESEPRLESGSSSSVDQSSNARREQSNSPIHRVTHEAVELKKKEATNSKLEMRSNTLDQLISEKQRSPEEKGRKKHSESKGSPPIPPRNQEPRFTVSLPHAQFDFNKPPPPPRPKMLYSPGLSYAAVTFANGDGPVYAPHVDSSSSNQRSSMKISQTGSDVSYASVDFQMTAGLQRTSEQVADHQREFFETKQSHLT